MKRFAISTAAVLLAFSAAGKVSDTEVFEQMAAQTLDSIYKYYSVPGTPLLRENYPFDTQYSASYLASEDKDTRPYAFLWPYSGTLSAATALLDASGERKYRKLLDEKVMPGLELYFDTKRKPAAYSSYIVSEPASDRFYDDNDWVGLDFIDLYEITGEKRWLDKARTVWKFIESGTDDRLGNGVYWCEQKRSSKNTCSTAPAIVLAMKLYKATGEKQYFNAAVGLYDWASKVLQDKEDFLYFDNISGHGKLDRRKFSYNSGQMLQAAVLLYKATGNKTYLDDAKRIAEASYRYFFEDFTTPSGETFRILKAGSTWFHSIMFRGFVELYKVDDERKYIDAVGKSLLNAWEHGRSAQGLFPDDFSGRRKQKRNWLLTQAAMVEMFSRMATLAGK